MTLKLNQSKFLKVVSVVLVILALCLFILALLMRLQFFKPKPVYSVVYIETGEIYVGQLSRFPYLRLANGFIVQQGPDNTVSLLPLSSTVWQPQGPLRLNPDKVVFTAALSETASLYRMIQSWKQNQDNGSAIPPTVPTPIPSP